MSTTGRARLLLLLGVFLLAACTREEGSIIFAGAQVIAGSDTPEGQAAGDILHVSLNARMSEPVLEALHHGVPLTLQIDSRAVVPRSWLPDEVLASSQTLLRLDWRPMTEQYVVTIPDTGEQLSVSNREGAGGALRGPFRIPLPRVDLGPDGSWRVHAELDLNALPSPLRLPAWFSSDWHMSSAWYAVERKP